jgi:hypothetical protein
MAAIRILLDGEALASEFPDGGGHPELLSPRQVEPAWI